MEEKNHNFYCVKKILKYFFLCVIFQVGIINAIAQQRNITGMVYDSANAPLLGVSVGIKGSSTGTITDVNGHYSITVPNNETVLAFSYIGYVHREITVGSQTTINVKLIESETSIDEVIVVAYGQSKKSTFTGSASVVGAEKLEKIQGTGFAEMMQGLSAGVNVTNVQGNPGADARVEIRGIASMSGVANPLYIVDGMPYDGGLNQINPADIESMTILKDAAATSLYGSRAANGVIMITTKKGKSGKPLVNFRGSWGSSDNAVANPKKADPYQQLENTWYALYYDALYFDKKSTQEAGDFASANALTKQVKATRDSKGNMIYVTPFKYINENYVLHDGKGHPYMNPNLQYVWKESDWDVYKAVFSRKLRQDYTIDVSGQTDNKISYYFSGGYLDDLGYGNRQYYKRYSFRTNLSAEILSWWKAGGSLAYSSYRQNLSGGVSRACNFTTTLSSPWLRNIDNTDWVYSEKSGRRMYDYGKYINNFFGIQVMSNSGDYWNNPNDDSFDNWMGHSMTAQFYNEFTLPLNLKFKTALNMDDSWSRHMAYGSAVHGSGQTEPYGTSILAEGGYAERYNYENLSITWNNVLSGEWKINKVHSFSAMAGHEWYGWNNYYDDGWGYGIMELGKYELANTTTEFGTWGGRDTYGLLSFFGRADYNYSNKYYLSGSVREDASSRFSPKERWGTFSSIGASWRISKENFLETKQWLDNLALRVSYGTTGNDRLIVRDTNSGKHGGEVLYGYQGTYTSDDLYQTAGLMPATYPTPDLKWESNHQLNIGMDFSFVNRISGTIEYYSRTSKGLLFYKDLPISAQVGGATGLNMNIGDLRNRGFEFTVNGKIIKMNDFRWDIDVNLTTLKNEVTYLPTESYVYNGVACTYKMEKGKSIYEFIAPQYDGANPDTGMPGWLIRDGKGGWKRTEKTAEVTTDDYVDCGSAIPNLFGSITNTLRYKGLDFSCMWYYSYGSKMSDYTYKERIMNRPGVGMVEDLVQNRWREPGDVGTVLPRWSYTQYSATVKYADNFLFDNRYWRLRNLTLGYTLPKSLVKKAMIGGLRVYITGNNLLTFGPAAKRHTDPETGIMGNSYNGNADTDNGIQGSRRIYMGGIQISF